MKVTVSALVLLCSLAGIVSAHEAPKTEVDVCATFDWPLTKELAWFSAPGLPSVKSGAMLPADHPAAELALEPGATANLPQAPSRELKPETFAGFVRLAAPAETETVQVTLSGEGWIDVASEGGSAITPSVHSGRRGCATLRKSVRFRVEAKPFVVSISNAKSAAIKLAVTPVEK